MQLNLDKQEMVAVPRKAVKGEGLLGISGMQSPPVFLSETANRLAAPLKAQPK